ncbi:MAG TPA: DUF2892 domain-containing protein [Cyclobacteriaceae bacterium]|nr:DUF2892 domain-containing protein [Cyclobacteriaceae bacterium]
MKNNMSKADRIIRVIIAVVLAAMYFSNLIAEGWGILVMAVSTVLLLTAFINFCPLYTLLGIKRWEKKSQTKISSSH